MNTRQSSCLQWTKREVKALSLMYKWGYKGIEAVEKLQSVGLLLNRSAMAIYAKMNEIKSVMINKTEKLSESQIGFIRMSIKSSMPSEMAGFKPTPLNQEEKLIVLDEAISSGKINNDLSVVQYDPEQKPVIQDNKELQQQLLAEIFFGRTSSATPLSLKKVKKFMKKAKKEGAVSMKIDTPSFGLFINF